MDYSLMQTQVKEAVNACVTLNQWDLGVSLANKYNFKEIGVLLSKYGTHLLAKNKLIDAIEA